MRVKRTGTGEVQTVSRCYGTRLIEQGKAVAAGPEKKATAKKAAPKRAEAEVPVEPE